MTSCKTSVILTSDTFFFLTPHYTYLEDKAEMYAGSEVTEARYFRCSSSHKKSRSPRRSIRFSTSTLMSSDLALQIGSMIGVSALLYFVTTPRKDLLDQVEEPALSGMKRFSSYHRIRFYNSMSSSSATSS